MTIDELNCEVSEIYADINELEKRFYADKEPFTDKIEALNEQYLDERLKDSSGETIKVGMVIVDKQNKHYSVTRRHQQYFFQFLGNAQVKALQNGKKKEISIGYRDLTDYTILR